MALSTQDFVVGVDTTGLTSIPNETLNNLVNLATPAAIIGLVISTTDVGGNAVVPDATTNPKWQQYIWRRITLNGVISYVWNPNGANNNQGLGFQLWYPITAVVIGNNTITNSMLQSLSITSDKIASCAWASITGVPDFIQSADVVPAGAFAGSPYNNLALAANSVTFPQIGSGAAPVNSALTADGSGNSNWQPGSAVIQMASTTVTSLISTTTVLAFATAPTVDNTTLYTGFGVAGDISFTPKSGTSTIVVEVDLEVSNFSGTPAGIQAGLFNGSALLSGDAARLIDAASETYYQKLRLSASFASVSTSALTLSVRFAALTTGGVSICRSGGYGSTYKITEHI